MQFQSDQQTNITFSLPQMHCSSCIYLLENLHRIDKAIITSKTNFQRKELFIIFDPRIISLRKVVELLAFIGYEPDISLKYSKQGVTNTFNRKRIYKLGVAGFSFANIMMLSFPEYFSSGRIEESGLKETFSWLIFALSLPVLFYSASGFFTSAWKGLRQRYLNIDAPIALAITVAFGRSYYEIITNSGPGFLDSGTGIVFFMLVGRWFQDKTYDYLSFDRDYRSYFPLGVTVVKKGEEINIPVINLKIGDHVIIRNEEMIPADAMLISGNAMLDYSFVSGEDTPVKRHYGDVVHAGGRQIGTAIELQIVKEVSQSYITQLWNNDVFSSDKNTSGSFIHPWSRYFTLALFSIAAGAVVYWWINNPANIFPVLTAVLLVACPCSLLLSATFTYGNMLRIFGKHNLYLKNAGVIERMAEADTIIFDKTGTITKAYTKNVSYEGTPLTEKEKSVIVGLARQSSNPLAKVIGAYVSIAGKSGYQIEAFKEYPGQGVEAIVNKIPIRIGSAKFMNEFGYDTIGYGTGTNLHLAMNDVLLGKFAVRNNYRKGLAGMIKELKLDGYKLHVLSGDTNAGQTNLRFLFGDDATIQFEKTPQQKLEFIRSLQQQNKKVLMIGDGLNDAGALRQADIGIAVSDNTARFTPACDAILDGTCVKDMSRFLSYARTGKKIVAGSFMLSILYNIAGLSFAVSAGLSPMVAAVLMPASSISIVLFVTLVSNFSARRMITR